MTTAAHAATTGPTPPTALVGPGPMRPIASAIMKEGMTVQIEASTRLSHMPFAVTGGKGANAISTPLCARKAIEAADIPKAVNSAEPIFEMTPLEKVT